MKTVDIGASPPLPPPPPAVRFKVEGVPRRNPMNGATVVFTWVATGTTIAVLQMEPHDAYRLSDALRQEADRARGLVEL